MMTQLTWKVIVSISGAGDKGMCYATSIVTLRAGWVQHRLAYDDGGENFRTLSSLLERGHPPAGLLESHIAQ